MARAKKPPPAPILSRGKAKKSKAKVKLSPDSAPVPTTAARTRARSSQTKEREKTMANHNDVSNHHDISGHVKAAPTEHHIHKINLGVHPGTPKPTDFDTQGVEVPAKAERERVNPSVAAAQRRTPLIDVTPIVSPSGNSHIGEPPPRKL
jgi:hypothetical protein